MNGYTFNYIDTPNRRSTGVIAQEVLNIAPESVDGGENGGTIVATGTPEEVAKSKKSYTGKYIWLLGL